MLDNEAYQPRDPGILKFYRLVETIYNERLSPSTVDIVTCGVSDKVSQKPHYFQQKLT